MHATEPQPLPADGAAVSLGARARTGDRDAIAALARLGGKKKAERDRQRKAEAASRVVLETIAQRRELLERLAAELAVARIDEGRKLQAAAAAVRALAELDAIDELRRERDALRNEVALLKALGAGSTPRVWQATFGEPNPPAQAAGAPHGGDSSPMPAAASEAQTFDSGDRSRDVAMATATIAIGARPRDANATGCEPVAPAAEPRGESR